MTFRPPYKFRICTEILGHVFELVRFQRPIYHSDEEFWFEGREERTWIERPLLDSETDTDRPRIGRHIKRPPLTRLKPEENAGLENVGLTPEFKSHE